VIGAAPLLTPALPFTAKNGFLKETINSATAPFQHSNDTSDLVIEVFCNFVINPPKKF